MALNSYDYVQLDLPFSASCFDESRLDSNLLIEAAREWLIANFDDNWELNYRYSRGLGEFHFASLENAMRFKLCWA